MISTYYTSHCLRKGFVVTLKLGRTTSIHIIDAPSFEDDLSSVYLNNVSLGLLQLYTIDGFEFCGMYDSPNHCNIHRLLMFVSILLGLVCTQSSLNSSSRLLCPSICSLFVGPFATLSHVCSVPFKGEVMLSSQRAGLCISS